MSGRMMNELLGKIHFWLFFVGVNMLFFPMHFLGLDGMPRRIPDYPDAFAYWNHVATMGYGVMAIGVVVFFINIFLSLARSEETTSELQSLMRISYAVFC